MSDSTLDDNELTSTQEYLIAGIVILLFGSLYWFLNHGPSNITTSSLNAYPPPVIASESNQNSLAIDTQPPKAIPLADMDNAGTKNTAQAAPTEQIAEATSETQIAELQDNSTDTDQAPESVPASRVEEDSTAEESQAIAEVQQAETVNGDNSTSDTTQSHTAENTNTDDTDTTAATQTATTVESTDNTDSLVIMGPAVAQLQDDLSNNRFENPLVLNSISFDPNSAEVKMDVDHQVKAIAGLLQQYPDSKVLIRGHTDAEGAPDSNKRLSLMRATAMGRKLVAAGANTQSIIIMGMGDTEPLSNNSNATGRRKNRRIDISVTQ